MKRVDNYQIQAGLAKQHFLQYDQQEIIDKLGLKVDDAWLYTRFLGQEHRVDRKTGDIFRLDGGNWVGANSFAEVLTLFDLMCDSKPDRFVVGKWKTLQAFGNQFHSSMLEKPENPFADAIGRDPQAFVRACERMGGVPVTGADIACSIELFDGLPLGLFFWEQDEDFPASIRYYLDENALMYLRYETMHYLTGLVSGRLLEWMQEKEMG